MNFELRKLKIYFCRYDFVKVYDGIDELGTQLGGGDLTGGPPAQITSTGTDIFIRFTTDSSETTAGFRIEFEAG